MNPEIIDTLHAAGALSDLDRSFADLMMRLSGSGQGALALAAALVSRASAEGDICLELSNLAGGPIPAGQTAFRCPALKQWISMLLESPVVGKPGDWRPLILDGTRLYLYRHWDAEQGLARFLLERSQVPVLGVDVALLREGLGRLFPARNGEADWQKIAAAVAVLKRFCAITGGPGTGKTTTVARILALLLEQAKTGPFRIALAAPTGKAAARLQEAIRGSAGGLACENGILEKLAGMEASTIHRLLGRRSGNSSFIRAEEELLPFDAVIVDEASMVSLHLLFNLVRSLPGDARLILLGDRDQLASVEAGAVLGDICGAERGRLYSRPFGKRVADASGQIVPLLPGEEVQAPVGDCIVELRQNYRFGAESGIGALARAINDGCADEALSILRGAQYGDLGFRALPKPRDLSRALGEIVLAGFYTEPLNFAFAPAFMREAQIRCAAEFKRPDLLAVKELAETGVLSLDGLITHHAEPMQADAAYRTAFGDPGCLKMVLDWRHCQ